MHSRKLAAQLLLASCQLSLLLCTHAAAASSACCFAPMLLLLLVLLIPLCPRSVEAVDGCEENCCWCTRGLLLLAVLLAGCCWVIMEPGVTAQSSLQMLTEDMDLQQAGKQLGHPSWST
jgi:hypothetical protein